MLRVALQASCGIIRIVGECLKWDAVGTGQVDLGKGTTGGGRDGMTHSWTVRQATAADTEALVALRNEVYGSHISAAEWRWKYFDNPAGGSSLFVAENGGRLVGHLGRTRAWVNLNGEPVPVAHFQDFMILPVYRRQGVGRALDAEESLAPAKDGIHISFSLVSPVGREFSLARQREGQCCLGNMVRLCMVLNPRAIVEKRIGPSLLAAVSEPPLRLLLHLWAGRKRRCTRTEDITIETVDSFDSRFDELWSSIKDGLPFGLWQDAEYLNWRYRACPSAQYTVLAACKGESLLGFIVLRWGDETEGRYRLGTIVDFLFAPQKLDAAPALISAAVNYFRAGGADAITLDIFGRGPFYRLFRSCGFFRRGQGLYFSVTPGSPDLPHSLLTDPGNWYLMESLT